MATQERRKPKIRKEENEKGIRFSANAFFEQPTKGRERPRETI
jgi:hypothetical protein